MDITHTNYIIIPPVDQEEKTKHTLWYALLNFSNEEWNVILFEKQKPVYPDNDVG